MGKYALPNFGEILLSEGLMRTLFLSVVLLLSPVASSAQVTLPKILSSHMVIQRDLPVHIWGDAPPGQPVTVSFRGETRGTETGPTGHWSVYLKPAAAGGPFQLTVKAVSATTPEATPTAPIVLDDIMVGDVWVAS